MEELSGFSPGLVDPVPEPAPSSRPSYLSFAKTLQTGGYQVERVTGAQHFELQEKIVSGRGGAGEGVIFAGASETQSGGLQLLSHLLAAGKNLLDGSKVKTYLKTVRFYIYCIVGRK